MLMGSAFIFLIGLAMGGLCKRLRMPPLIGMLIAGIVTGPHMLGLLEGGILAASAELRQIALIVILARAGLSLDLTDLKRIGRPAVLMSFVPACFEMTGTIVLGTLLFGLPLLDAAILAVVVASASPAVIVPRMIKLMDEGYGVKKNIPQLILAGDSVDDVFNIVVFYALLGIANGEGASVWQFAAVPVSILTGAVGGFAVGSGLAFVMKRVPMRHTAKAVVLLAVALLLAAIEEVLPSVLPYSGLLAVMAMGVAVLHAAPKAAGVVSAKLSKLWVGAEVMLFVLVGASVDITYAAGAGGKTLILLALVLAARAVGIQLCLLKTPLNGKERLFCAFTGIPKATVQAAIGGIPLAMGLSSGNLILSVAVVAILVTAPVGAYVLDASYKRLLTQKEGSEI